MLLRRPTSEQASLREPGRIEFEARVAQTSRTIGGVAIVPQWLYEYEPLEARSAEIRVCMIDDRRNIPFELRLHRAAIRLVFDAEVPAEVVFESTGREDVHAKGVLSAVGFSGEPVDIGSETFYQISRDEWLVRVA